MLAAIVVFGLQQGTFDLTKMGTSTSTWLFLGFVVAFAIKSPLFPFHGWLPDHLPRVAARGRGGALRASSSKAGLYGLLRIVIPKFPTVVHDWRVVLLVLASISLVYGSLLAFRAPDFRGVDHVLVARAGRPDRARALREQRRSASTAPCCRWSTTRSSRRRCSCSPAWSSGARRPASSAARRDGARPACARDADHDRRASSRSPCRSRRRSRASS